MALDNPTAIRADMKRKAWATEKRRSQLERCRETAKITVVERGDVRIETRGNCVCASSAGVRRQYVTAKGVTYIA